MALLYFRSAAAVQARVEIALSTVMTEPACLAFSEKRMIRSSELRNPNWSMVRLADFLARAPLIGCWSFIQLTRALDGRTHANSSSPFFHMPRTYSALDAILRSSGFVAKRDGKFIYVGTPQDFLAMEHTLDKIGTRIYRPNYVTATELNTLITPLLTQGSGIASVTSAAESGIAEDDDKAGDDEKDKEPAAAGEDKKS